MFCRQDLEGEVLEGQGGAVLEADVGHDAVHLEDGDEAFLEEGLAADAAAGEDAAVDGGELAPAHMGHDLGELVGAAAA